MRHVSRHRRAVILVVGKHYPKARNTNQIIQDTGLPPRDVFAALKWLHMEGVFQSETKQTIRPYGDLRVVYQPRWDWDDKWKLTRNVGQCVYEMIAGDG